MFLTVDKVVSGGGLAASVVGNWSLPILLKFQPSSEHVRALEKEHHQIAVHTNYMWGRGPQISLKPVEICSFDQRSKHDVRQLRLKTSG